MQLYQSSDLLAGYVSGEPGSYVETWDFRQFAAFIKAGGPTTSDKAEALRQAEHDTRLNVALGAWLTALAKASGGIAANLCSSRFLR